MVMDYFVYMQLTYVQLEMSKWYTSDTIVRSIIVYAIQILQVSFVDVSVAGTLSMSTINVL